MDCKVALNHWEDQGTIPCFVKRELYQEGCKLLPALCPHYFIFVL